MSNGDDSPSLFAPAVRAAATPDLAIAASMTAAALRKAARAFALFVLPTLILCLCALEAGLRIDGRLPSNTTEGLFEQHGTAYRLRKNFSKLSRTPSFSCAIHTNDRGFRDRAPGPRKFGPAPYVAFVGDSLTFGNGLDYDDTFVGVFADRARERGLEVANLAVPGLHLAEMEEALTEFLVAIPQAPTQVVVVLSPLTTALFDARYTDVVVKNGFIFREDSGLGTHLTVALGNESSAYCFFRDAFRKLQTGLRSRDRTAGALSIAEPFSRSSRLARSDVAARLDAQLARFDAAIRRSGATPVYAYLPGSTDLMAEDLAAGAGRAHDYDFLLYRNLIEDHCRRSGLRFVDLRPAVRALSDRGETLSFLQDAHYSAVASRAIGAALFGAMF